MAHLWAFDVARTALAQMSTAVAINVVAEVIFYVRAAPEALRVIVPVTVVQHLEDLLAVLSIFVEIVAESNAIF